MWISQQSGSEMSSVCPRCVENHLSSFIFIRYIYLPCRTSTITTFFLFHAVRFFFFKFRISKISPSKKSPENRRSFASDVSVTSAIQLALLLLPTELRFQMQVFFEQAQEVVANAKRHLRPETTLEFVQPSQVCRNGFNTHQYISRLSV